MLLSFSTKAAIQRQFFTAYPSSIRTGMPGPLTVFFAQYPDFDYNNANSAPKEFYRLCSLKRWDKNKRKVAKDEFDNALTMQFNANYGTDVNDLTKWQALCARLRMAPVPECLSECREAVKSKHVNLVDLVDNFGTRKKVRIFPSVVALSKYTKAHKKFFPRDNAHAGNLLKFLLRQIMNPRLANEGGHARGRGRGRGRGVGGRKGRKGSLA